MTKKIINVDVGTYAFNPTNKTITLSGLDSNLTLENLLIITNVTDNIPLYNFADSTLGATISNNIITLEYDTTTMNADDNIQIFIEDGQAQQIKLIDLNGSTVNPATNDTLILLRRLVKLLESNATVDSANRQRIAVETAVISSGTITTITNAVPVGNVATIANVDPRYQMADLARTVYNTGIRANIKIT